MNDFDKALEKAEERDVPGALVIDDSKPSGLLTAPPENSGFRSLEHKARCSNCIFFIDGMIGSCSKHRSFIASPTNSICNEWAAR